MSDNKKAGRKFYKGDVVTIASTGERGTVSHYSYGQVVVKVGVGAGLHQRRYVDEDQLIAGRSSTDG